MNHPTAADVLLIDINCLRKLDVYFSSKLFAIYFNILHMEIFLWIPFVLINRIDIFLARPPFIFSKMEILCKIRLSSCHLSFVVSLRIRFQKSNRYLERVGVEQSVMLAAWKKILNFIIVSEVEGILGYFHYPLLFIVLSFSHGTGFLF